MRHRDDVAIDLVAQFGGEVEEGLGGLLNCWFGVELVFAFVAMVAIFGNVVKWHFWRQRVSARLIVSERL